MTEQGPDKPDTSDYTEYDENAGAKGETFTPIPAEGPTEPIVAQDTAIVENHPNTVITGTPFTSADERGRAAAGARAWTDSNAAGAGDTTQEQNAGAAMKIDKEETRPLPSDNNDK